MMQKRQMELDRLVIFTEITKFDAENNSIDAPAEDGAYISGLFLQGARWSVEGSTVDKAKPKEMVSKTSTRKKGSHVWLKYMKTHCVHVHV